MTAKKDTRLTSFRRTCYTGPMATIYDELYTTAVKRRRWRQLETQVSGEALRDLILRAVDAGVPRAKIAMDLGVTRQYIAQVTAQRIAA